MNNKEIYLAYEEATKRNVQMILDHSNETRRLTKELEDKTMQMQEQILIQNNTIEELRHLLVTVQSKLYIGGS